MTEATLPFFGKGLVAFMALSNANFDGILSTLVPAWVDDNWVSLFTSHNALWAKLRADGMIQGGWGTKITGAVFFPTTTGPRTAGVGDSYAERTAAPETGMSGFEYIGAQYLRDVSVDEYDLDKYDSQTQKVNWTQEVVAHAMEDFNQTLAADIWAREEAANSVGTKTQVASIRTLYNSGSSSTTTDGGAIPAALAEQKKSAINGLTGTTPQTTVGGFDRTAAGAAYWCTPMLGVDTAADTFSIKFLSKGYSLGVVGTETPTLIVTHRDVFDVIQNLASLGGSNGGQFQNNSRLADLGFDAIRFRNADIICDDRVPVGGSNSGDGYATSTAKGYQMFYLNTKYVQLRMGSKSPNMRPVDDPRPIKRWTARMLLALISKNPGRVGNTRHVNIALP